MWEFKNIRETGPAHSDKFLTEGGGGKGEHVR